MEFAMIKVIITFLCLLFPTVAFSGNVTKEIKGYRDIRVVFSPNAHKCDLKDAKAFSGYLAKKLAGLGIKKRDDSIVVIRLGVSGASFGLIKGHCALGTDLSFRTILKAENIVTKNDRVRAAVDRLGAFPINLYNIGQFGVEARVETGSGKEKRVLVDEKVFEMLDRMVERFAKARKS
jgi:hypothetical protein